MTDVQPDPFAPIDDDPALPRVLILGDSISIGYTLPTRELLASVANVHRPPDNCRSTKYWREQLEGWLGDGRWDVIHFNSGLHDIVWMLDGQGVKAGTGAHQVALADYRVNMEWLVTRLEQTGATLIWCSTTPVPDVAGGRATGDEVERNDAAAEIMAKHGVQTNDLYSYALARLDKIQLPQNVHFSPEGSAELAKPVAAAIRATLPAAAR